MIRAAFSSVTPHSISRSACARQRAVTVWAISKRLYSNDCGDESRDAFKPFDGQMRANDREIDSNEQQTDSSDSPPRVQKTKPPKVNRYPAHSTHPEYQPGPRFGGRHREPDERGDGYKNQYGDVLEPVIRPAEPTESRPSYYDERTQEYRPAIIKPSDAIRYPPPPAEPIDFSRPPKNFTPFGTSRREEVETESDSTSESPAPSNPASSNIVRPTTTFEGTYFTEKSSGAQSPIVRTPINRPYTGESFQPESSEATFVPASKIPPARRIVRPLLDAEGDVNVEIPEENEQRQYNPAAIIPPTVSIVPIRRDPLPPPKTFEPLGKTSKFRPTHTFNKLLHSNTEVQVYISNSIDPAHNLALEHILFTRLNPSVVHLFLYRNDRAVVIGRNQNPWLESNHPIMIPNPDAPTVYPDGKKIPTPLPPPALLRRRSGGGTVFHDLGNVNYSISVPTAEFSRSKHAELMASVLRDLGVETAKVNDRHDIIINSPSCVKDTDNTPDPDGVWPLKVSGSAFKLTKDRSYHHGTMLCTSHLGQMRFIRSPLKELNCVKAHGVESVRADVDNTGVDPEQFMMAAAKAFQKLYAPKKTGLAVIQPTDPTTEVGFAEELQTMQSQDWVYGQTPRFWLTLPCKAGVIEVDKGLIVSPASHAGKKFGSTVVKDILKEKEVEEAEQWGKSTIGGTEWGKWKKMEKWEEIKKKMLQKIEVEAEMERNEPERKMKRLLKKSEVLQAFHAEKKATKQKREDEKERYWRDKGTTHWQGRGSVSKRRGY